MAPPPQTTDGAADPVELQHRSNDGEFPSGEIESVVPSVLAKDLTSNEPSGEVKAVDSSTHDSAMEVTSKVEQSPESKEPSAEMNDSVEKEKSNREFEASKIKQLTENYVPSAQIENSTETEKPTAVELSAAAMDKENSADKSNGEFEASKIKQLPENSAPSAQIENSSETEKSTTVEMSAAAMDKENSAEKFNGEFEASKIKQLPENNAPSAQIENSSETEKSTSEKFGREMGELMHRLDPSGAVTLMCLASPLYAVLAAWPLWLFTDQPQAFLWTFAHLACLYLFLWIIILSTTNVSTVFFRITYLLMLAYTVVQLIGPMNGMIFLYIGMIYVAGTLGYALAEHFERAGFEQTANALCSSPFNKDCEEKVSIMHFVTVLMSAPILARMAWVTLVPYSGHMTRMDVLQVVVELTAEIFVLAVLWILYFTQFILRGALVSMERFVSSAFICWIACYALAMLLSFYIAEAVGMLVMWLGWMAIGGFFGYSLAVRAFYCKMLARIDSTPAAQEQNGGT